MAGVCQEGVAFNFTKRIIAGRGFEMAYSKKSKKSAKRTPKIRGNVGVRKLYRMTGKVKGLK